MMRTVRVMAAVAAFAMGGAAVAAAQRPIEFGIDGGVQFQLDDPKTTVIGLPTQAMRVGFFLADRISVEPSVAFNWFKVSGEDSFSNLAVDAGLLYHLSTAADRSQLYVRPLVGFSRISGDGESISQVQAGGGIGVKIPAGDRLKLRLEGNLKHGFETDDLASGTALGLTIGFSFLTR